MNSTPSVVVPNATHYWIITKSGSSYTTRDAGPISITINGTLRNNPAPIAAGLSCVMQCAGTPTQAQCAAAFTSASSEDSSSSLASYSTSSSPATGGTVTGSDTPGSELLDIEPGATIATLTIYLEAADNLPLGSVKQLGFGAAITALTISATAAGGGTLKGSALSSATVNGTAAYKKTASKTWRRLY